MKSMIIGMLWIAGTTVLAADSPPLDPYGRVVDAYLSANWDELDEALKAKELNALTGSKKLDVAYVKTATAETRPAWWKTAKAGKEVNIRTTIWGRPLVADYVPADKPNLNMNFTNEKWDFKINWPPTEMDNKNHAEHGFTKGELCNLTIWQTLGCAYAYSTVNTMDLVRMNDSEKQRLAVQVELMGNLAGAYYGDPRARRWAFYLGMHFYQDKYAKAQNVMARKTLGAFFIAEVLSNASKYPSIKFPEKLEAAKAEEKLGLAVHQHIEKNGWTLAEDRQLRESLLKFTNSASTVFKSNTLNLPGGTLSLDNKADATHMQKRDAWVKKQFDRVVKP